MGKEVRDAIKRIDTPALMASIAKRYKLAPAQVAQWNKIGQGARFARGQQIVVFVPVKEPFGIVALETMAAGKPLIAINEGTRAVLAAA